MANVVARSLADTSSEHASAAACSALRYDIAKDVGILSVVMTIRKLRQIQWQISFTDLMKRTHHPSLQKAPEAVQVRRMDVPTQHTHPWRD